MSPSPRLRTASRPAPYSASRSHAGQTQLSLSHSTASSTAEAVDDVPHKKRAWTVEEDTVLTQQVESQKRNGAEHINWKEVSKHFQGRETKDCRKRWTASLAPDVHKGVWSPSEDAALREGMRLYPYQWSKIAAHVGHRTGDQCSCHWDVLSSNSQWNDNLDKILLRFVKKNGKRWSEARRQHLPQFTSAECRNRYNRLMRKLSATFRRDTEMATLQLARLDEDSEGEMLGGAMEDKAAFGKSNEACSISEVPNTDARGSLSNYADGVCLPLSCEGVAGQDGIGAEWQADMPTARRGSWPGTSTAYEKMPLVKDPTLDFLTDMAGSNHAGVATSMTSPTYIAESTGRARFKDPVGLQNFLRRGAETPEIRQRLVQLAEMIMTAVKDGAESDDAAAAAAAAAASSAGLVGSHMGPCDSPRSATLTQPSEEKQVPIEESQSTLSMLGAEDVYLSSLFNTPMEFFKPSMDATPMQNQTHCQPQVSSRYNAKPWDYNNVDSVFRMFSSLHPTVN